MLELIGKRFGWGRSVTLIAVAAFVWQFGFGLYRTIYDNFLWQELGIHAQQLGYIEGVREVPGLVTMVLAAITAGVTQSVLAGACILLIALGLGLFSIAYTFSDLVWMTILFSTGFHLVGPIQNALILGHTREGHKGTRLGQFASINAISALAAMGLVFITSSFVSFRTYFIIAGVVTVGGALVMFTLPRPRKRQRITRRLVFNREYMSYYILTLLGGSRRHIFMTFGVYNLVQRFDVPVGRIAVLLAIGNILSVYGRPLMGRFVDSVGERKVLTVSYIVVSTVFAGYALVSYLPALYLLFCVDALFRFEFVLTTYLDKIADSDEMAPTLAMGVTINHIAGVLVPIVGGYLWEQVSPQITFLVGTAVALVSLAYCLVLRDERFGPGFSLPLSDAAGGD